MRKAHITRWYAPLDYLAALVDFFAYVAEITFIKVEVTYQLRKEVYTVSNRDFAKTLIDRVPDSKILYVIAYLQGVTVPDEAPNAETIKVIEEVEKMIRTGSHADLFDL